MKATADTPRLAPKPLTMLVESGASGHCFDDELLSDPKAKHLNCKELCKALVWPHNILAAGRHALPGTATGVISKQINDMDGNKHPVENSGLVAPGRHNRFFNTAAAAQTRGQGLQRGTLWVQLKQQSIPDVQKQDGSSDREPQRHLH